MTMIDERERLLREFEGHTPGPWRDIVQEGNLRIYGPDDMGEHSCLIATIVFKGRANGRLIAAAPRLVSENADLLRQRDEARAEAEALGLLASSRADEVAALRAALREIAQLSDDRPRMAPLALARVHEIARAALTP